MSATITSLPQALLEQIGRGRAVLFLGAGASHGATSPDGRFRALNGNDLGRALSDRFLSGEYKGASLRRIADFAASEHSLGDVQQFVKDRFDPLEPTAAHRLIPRFRWHAIVTTNYDRLIEKAYYSDTSRLQNPVPILRNGDNFSRAIEDAKAIPILKLHGCVTCINDPALPLVLSNEQYAAYGAQRTRLVQSFQEWAYEHPIVFCGYDLQDEHVLRILFNLEDGSINRHRYLTVGPDHDDISSRYWAKHRIDACASTFDAFMHSLDAKVPESTRTLGTLLTESQGPITKWLKSNNQLSSAARSALEGRFELISRDLPLGAVVPSEFYRGASQSWAPIAAALDVERRVATEVTLDWLATLPIDPGPKFLLLLGHAGSGKSVALRRIAWDAATDWNRLVFFSSQGLRGAAEFVQELATATGERILFVVDDLLDEQDELLSALKHWKRNNTHVTVIGAARTNEWNLASSELTVMPDESYDVENLSEREVRELLSLLEKHRCLGTLSDLKPEERVNRFMEDHERQLLVALHELTLGKPFREIVKDEWTNIVPAEAQQLYLDVCTMNQFRVPARAGLVSRLSGIRLTDFKERFFAPLERVVFTRFDTASRDYAYTARHSCVAELVFEEVLGDPNARVTQLIRIISHLNTEYESDDFVSSRLLRGKELALQFSDPLLADRIFDAADAGTIPKAFLKHQRALFELNHAGRRPEHALELLDEALAAPGRMSRATLLHTKAVVLRKLSGQHSGVARDKYRNDAIAILKEQLKTSSSHTYTTLCELLLDDVGDRIEALHQANPDNKLSRDVLTDRLAGLERHLEDALQRFPTDVHLMRVRSRLEEALNGQPAAITFLRKACDANPGNEMLVCRLTALLLTDGSATAISEAQTRLQACLSYGPNSRALNFKMATVLRKLDEQKYRLDISKHLKRSFNEGDSRFRAQLAFARHEFLYGDRNRATQMFKDFRLRGVPGMYDSNVRDIVLYNGAPVSYVGQIVALKTDFGFARCAEVGDVFVHRKTLDPKYSWPAIQIGDSLRFNLNFSFRGPNAINTELMDFNGSE